MRLKNLFDMHGVALDKGEFTETLFSGNGFRVERIVSKGHVTERGKWYDQSGDEWVTVLRGKAEIMYDDMSVDELCEGDWVLIPAHARHRVSSTSECPECVWLAVHKEG